MQTDWSGRGFGQVRSFTGAAWPGLLAPEDTVIWKRPDDLAASLTTELADGATERAFVVSNRLALELFRVGLRTEAEDVCRRQIAFARGLLQHSPTPGLLVLGLQGAVNLIRMHGYTSDPAFALDALSQLERVADGKPAEIMGVPVPTRLSTGTGLAMSRVRGFARSNRILETAKILFRRGEQDLASSECRRLCRKWPTAAATGPFHAHEVLCLLGVPWPEPNDFATAAPVLQRIALLRGAAGERSTARARATAASLFESRVAPEPGHGAAARFLAALGDLLYTCRLPEAGAVSFREAHRMARPVDPNLANSMVRRWRDHATDHEVLPPLLDVPAARPEQLLSISDLLAARFDGSRRPTGPDDRPESCREEKP
ncbi:hypothetical protein [Kitasatospora sp. NPDC088783]|uniref:hypothetical protein n=1 Tax=Kitasatospora sp. NPDC088783 TaxID=3364077 RepID=UPI003822A1C7